MNTKTCSKCGVVKEVAEFRKRRYGRQCRQCLQNYRKQNYELNKERDNANSREWSKNNPDKTREIQRRARTKDKIRRYAYTKNWNSNNKDWVLATKRQYNAKLPNCLVRSYLKQSGFPGNAITEDMIKAKRFIILINRHGKL